MVKASPNSDSLHTKNKPARLKNFVTFHGLENLKEHGVIMLGQTAKVIARQQPSLTTVAAFYATVAAIATLGLAILIISANVAYAVAH